ncbi:PASTA domain-containing protein, partial [Nitrospirota bacterium]
MRWYIRIPLSMILFIVVCSVSAYGTFVFLSKGLTVEVPDLSGRSHDESKLIISELGLVLTVAGEQYDRTVPAGYIMKQDVQPGTHLHGQGEVAIILSKGPEVRLIPSVLEKTLEDARAVFMEKG